MYIESQAKGQLGVAMQELSDMNPLPMNRMLERQSKEEAIAKRTERKGKTVKDVPPTTAGNSVGCLWHSHGKNPVRLYPKLQSQPIGLRKTFIDYLFFQVDQWDCTKPLSICDRFASSDCTQNCKASQ